MYIYVNITFRKKSIRKKRSSPNGSMLFVCDFSGTLICHVPLIVLNSEIVVTLKRCYSSNIFFTISLCPLLQILSILSGLNFFHIVHYPIVPFFPRTFQRCLFTFAILSWISISSFSRARLTSILDTSLSNSLSLYLALCLVLTYLTFCLCSKRRAQQEHHLRVVRSTKI